MSSLYRATAPQVFDDIFKYQAWFSCAFFEGGQVFGIFQETQLNRLIDDIGQRTVCFGCLDS